MYLQSDHYMKIENARLVFERGPENGQSKAFYGIMCDQPPTGRHMMDSAEVRLLLRYVHLDKMAFKVSDVVILTHACASGPLVCSRRCRRLLLGRGELRRSLTCVELPKAE